MKSTIALIGSQAFCGHARNIVLPEHIHIDCYEYKDPDEASVLIEMLKPCDAVLFSGSLPYEASKEKLSAIAAPAFYLQQNEQTVAATLLYLAYDKNVAAQDISIDLKNTAHISNVLLDMYALSNGGRPAVFDLSAGHDLQAVVNFHIAHYKSGRTKTAVTSVHAVYDQLQAAGIPCFRMIDPVSNIISALENAASQADLQRSQASKNAVALLKVHEPSCFNKNIAVALANCLQAQWTANEQAFYFYTTHGNIEFALSLEEFQQLAQSLHPAASLAFGCGHSTVEASENAASALHLAAASTRKGIYLLDEQKKLHGPLQASSSSVHMQIDDPVLLQLSKKTSLSPAAISKLLQFNQLRQASPFTANDLAGYLQVSRRTAERTIKKLLDQQFIAVTGEEMTYSQGRPRSLYTLRLPI